jgi:hypothetical protein
LQNFNPDLRALAIATHNVEPAEGLGANNPVQVVVLQVGVDILGAPAGAASIDAK